MLYNVHDTHIGRSLDCYGEFSHDETKVFARMIRPGTTVLDVGANIGVHSLYFAEAVGANGVVLAFEPQRALYQILCANIALNEIYNVRALQLGLGRENGQGFMPVLDYSRSGNFGATSIGADGADQIMVATIDSLGLEHCHFIKIDVEGMEEEVIAGAAQTIARCRPLLYVENDRRDKSASLIRRLLELDYVLYWHSPYVFSSDNIYGNPINIFPHLISLNMICVPKEQDHELSGFRQITDPLDWPLST
jgi:FkbM family methyltransferase